MYKADLWFQDGSIKASLLRRVKAHPFFAEIILNLMSQIEYYYSYQSNGQQFVHSFCSHHEICLLLWVYFEWRCSSSFSRLFSNHFVNFLVFLLSYFLWVTCRKFIMRTSLMHIKLLQCAHTHGLLLFGKRWLINYFSCAIICLIAT